MKKAVAAMLVFACILVVVSLFVPVKEQTVIYHHPVFVMGILYLVVQTAAALGFGASLASLRRIGFFLCHGGFLLLALGALLGYMTASSVQIVKPIEDGRELPRIYEEIAGNGRMLTTENFSALANAADYLYDDQLTVYADGQSLDTGFWLYVTSFSVEKNDDGSPRQYRATLKATQDGQAEQFTVSVNHPTSYGGYLFYLTSYEEAPNPTYVILTVRRDIGRMPVRIGLWCVMIGTFFLCFFERKKEVQKV